MRKTVFLLFLVSIIVGLSLTRAFVSNKISTSGVELGTIQRESKMYQVENSTLREKVNMLSSLTYIFDKAKKLGFTESKSSFAISSARPLALKQ